LRRALICVALAIGGVLPFTPSNAASTQPSLTVVGSRTAYADIRLANKTDFDLSHAVLTGGGRFVGLYVETLDQPPADRDRAGARVGIVRIRDYHPAGEVAPTLTLGNTTWLAPGHYRVYLVSDGTATIRVPVAGSSTLVVKPHNDTRAAAVVGPDIMVNPVEASNRQRLQLNGHRTINFSTITIGRFRAFAGQVGACLALPGQDCGTAAKSGIDGAYTGWYVSPLDDQEFTFTLGYDAGVLPLGRYDAVQQAVNATTMQFAVAAAFTLTLR
jgi:hypothetical protein